MPKKILIVAGEPSGDLHASNLVKDLKSLDNSLKFFGMGGELSRAAGVETVFDITKLALVGVVEVLKHLSTVKEAYNAVIAKVGSEKPDLAILVDYPGFNLKLAGELKKRSIPVVYYISPQVWAWGRSRVNIIKKCVKRILVFFKFEEELYKTYDIDARFVGHPLLDSVKVTASRADTRKKYDISDASRVVALLPGSRKMEVELLLPIMMNAARYISEKLPSTKFIIAKHPSLPLAIYERALKDLGVKLRVANGDAYNVMNASDLAIVASGTATLESAIVGTPSIIVYKVNFLTYLLAELVMKNRFLGLVNLIADKEIAPEFLQFDATPRNVAKCAEKILKDDSISSEMRREMNLVRVSLGNRGASKRAAEEVIDLLK